MNISQDSSSYDTTKSSTSDQSAVQRLKHKSENIDKFSTKIDSSSSKEDSNNKIDEDNRIVVSKLSFNNCIKSQMKKHQKDFAISEQIQVNRLPKVVYYLQKKVCSIFNRKKISFTLTNDNKFIIEQTIDIKKGSTQFKTNQTYFINFTSGKNIFNMKQDNSSGNKFMTITYLIEDEPFKHKMCQILFHTTIPGLSNQLMNIPPKINSKGKAILPFGKRKVLPSTKNMIFIDPNKSYQNEIMSIMKVSKSTISIEAISILPEEMIFVIGVSSFLNHSS